MIGRLAGWDPSSLIAPGGCLNCGARGRALCSGCLTELEVIADQGCRRCGNPLVHRDADTCSWCETIKVTPAQVCTLFAYRETGRQLFHLIKYMGYWRLTGQLMEHHLRHIFRSLSPLAYDCLVPIPESFSRKWRRHYNPAGVVAEALSQRTALPLKQLLRTRPFHRHQVGLDHKARRKNARQRYRPRRGPMPERVILVDDVLTTGATMEAATLALLKAGVKRVAWFTLFRTL